MILRQNRVCFCFTLAQQPPLGDSDTFQAFQSVRGYDMLLEIGVSVQADKCC